VTTTKGCDEDAGMTDEDAIRAAALDTIEGLGTLTART
jgi:hypothetical protein